MIERGLFIVIEGLDRSGKSSQCKILADWLKGEVKLMRFPDRKSGQIGTMIDSYLNQNVSMSDEAIHLLFSANRWELVEEIVQAINSGVHVICDRYLYSGVVYSAAKGLDWQWCQAADKNLPQPDLVLFLDVDPNIAQTRGNYGNERYERVDFQNKVRSLFARFQQTESDYWQVIDANLPMAQVTENLQKIISKTLNANLGLLKKW